MALVLLRSHLVRVSVRVRVRVRIRVRVRRPHQDVLEGEEASGRLVLGRLEVVEYVTRDDDVPGWG